MAGDLGRSCFRSAVAYGGGAATGNTHWRGRSEELIPQSSQAGAAVRLTPGYYIVRVNAGPGPQAGSVRIKSEGSVYKPTQILFERGGSVLVRLRKPANVLLCAENCANGQAPFLTHRKLGRLGGAYIKLISGNRLDGRIPMIDGTGYICILRGEASVIGPSGSHVVWDVR